MDDSASTKTLIDLGPKSSSGPGFDTDHKKSNPVDFEMLTRVARARRDLVHSGNGRYNTVTQ